MQPIHCIPRISLTPERLKLNARMYPIIGNIFVQELHDLKALLPLIDWLIDKFVGNAHPNHGLIQWAFAGKQRQNEILT